MQYHGTIIHHHQFTSWHHIIWSSDPYKHISMYFGDNAQAISNTDIDDLVQDCSIPSALAMEILQSCTKPSMIYSSRIPFKRQVTWPGTNGLTLWGLGMHKCINEPDNLWFREWLVTCSVKIHYLNQCWLITHWNLRKKLKWNLIEIQHFYSRKCIRKCLL